MISVKNNTMIIMLRAINKYVYLSFKTIIFIIYSFILCSCFFNNEGNSLKSIEITLDNKPGSEEKDLSSIYKNIFKLQVRVANVSNYEQLSDNYVLSYKINDPQNLTDVSDNYRDGYPLCKDNKFNDNICYIFLDGTNIPGNNIKGEVAVSSKSSGIRPKSIFFDYTIKDGNSWGNPSITGEIAKSVFNNNGTSNVISYNIKSTGNPIYNVRSFASDTSIFKISNDDYLKSVSIIIPVIKNTTGQVVKFNVNPLSLTDNKEIKNFITNSSCSGDTCPLVITGQNGSPYRPILPVAIISKLDPYVTTGQVAGYTATIQSPKNSNINLNFNKFSTNETPITCYYYSGGKAISNITLTGGIYNLKFYCDNNDKKHLTIDYSTIPSWSGEISL